MAACTSAMDVSKVHDTLIDLCTDVLNVEQVTKFVTSKDCGAISVFIGTTRDCDMGRKVLSLEYEAYEQMAKGQMLDIAENIRLKWLEVKKIAMVHRLGVVPVAEVSVIIAVSSPHRAQALTAVNYAIDQLKAKVPIWKKEIYANGDSGWKANKECTWNERQPAA